MILLLVHAAATWAMVGFIWTIQVLQYPLMAAVPEHGFARFEQRHRIRVSVVIALFAPIELVTAAWLAIAPGEVPLALVLVAWALLAAIWVATALHYAPLHGRLSDGFDRAAHRRLVTTNWFRTGAWTARGVLALWMVTF